MEFFMRVDKITTHSSHNGIHSLEGFHLYCNHNQDLLFYLALE